MCIFPHAGAAPSSPAGSPACFWTACPTPESNRSRTPACGQLGQHLYFGGANPSSLLANAIAKFSLPKTPSLCVRGLLRRGRGGSASLCTWHVLLPSGKGLVFMAPTTTFLVLRCMRLCSMPNSNQSWAFWSGASLGHCVTCFTFLSPWARWTRNAHLCFPRYFYVFLKPF